MKSKPKPRIRKPTWIDVRAEKDDPQFAVLDGRDKLLAVCQSLVLAEAYGSTYTRLNGEVEIFRVASVRIIGKPLHKLDLSKCRIEGVKE
jgi:hypothetical protein